MKPTPKTIFALIFSAVIPFLSSTALGDIIPKAYYRDQKVDEFKEKGTLQAFAQIDDDLKAWALSELLEMGELVGLEEKAMPHRKQILEKYLSSPKSRYWDEAHRYAFLLAVESRNKDLIPELFEKASKADLQISQGLICESISNAMGIQLNDEPDLERLPMVELDIQNLVPLVSKQPSLADKPCEFGEDGTTHLTIRSLIEMTSGDLAKKLPARGGPATTGVAIAESSCNENQIHMQFSNALVILKPLKAPVSQLIVFQEGACKINGLLKKTKLGFEFDPSHGKPESKAQVMTFRDLSEIKTLFKATQRPSVAKINSGSEVKTRSQPSSVSVTPSGSAIALPFGAR